MSAFITGLMRWWPLPFFLVQAVMAWGMWSLGQKFVSRDECKASMGSGTARAEDINRRLTELEASIHALPSRNEVLELRDKITGLSENLGRVDGRLGGINRAVDLLNQHHLRAAE